MTQSQNSEYWAGVADQLLRRPFEVEWIEFKHNKADPITIGEYISALANAAALHGESNGYLLWGVEDATRRPVGTSFQPMTAKGAGAEDLHNWLARLLNPKVTFQFVDVELDGARLILLIVPAAATMPAAFQGQEFIRIGSNTKKLKDFPDLEKRLWQSFDATSFEQRTALPNCTRDDVLQKLVYTAYFELLKLPLPSTPDAIVDSLAADNLVAKSGSGGWDITNLGAITLAKQLSDFPSVARKATRVIIYGGDARVKTIKEQVGTLGYAASYARLISYISDQLPTNEVIEKAIRKTVPMYPELAIRELVANALIHQDFSITGAGPMIELFKDRMEVTNPGMPLIAPERFLDLPPRSRNERLAALMRRFGICEERGSGIDKVVFEVELYQLPAPLFETLGTNTRATLFAHQPLTKMGKDARVRACYLHACLRYVSRQEMSNTTLRERFGVEEKNKATVSRFIREALDSGLIVPQDAQAAPKMMRYLPFWAGPAR